MGGELKFAKPKRIVKKGKAYIRFTFEVHEADGWRCLVCGERKPLTTHHLIKRSKTRLDTLANCISACVGCHDLIEANLISVRLVDAERRVLEVTHR